MHAMPSLKTHGPVASLRTQARGHDVGAGDQEAVRVVDLVDRNGRRLVHVDVWRAGGGVDGERSNIDGAALVIPCREGSTAAHGTTSRGSPRSRSPRCGPPRR